MSLEFFKEAYNNQIEKRGRLEIEKSLATDGEQKYSLDKKIAACEWECERLKEILIELVNDTFLEIPGSFTSNIAAKNKTQPIFVAQVQNKKEEPAHLTIAVFHDLEKKQSIRVQTELCYLDPETRALAKISLLENAASVAIAEFSKFLQKLVSFADRKLSQIYRDDVKPWQLIIDLFVPIEKLCDSLKYWCGESSQLAREYPLVLRCSDRFNPEIDKAFYLHNQIKKGWQRLSSSETPLKQIDWVQPDDSFDDDLEPYAGLQCFGQWLRSGESYFDRWVKLVESGIPLALWTCGVRAERDSIAQTFDWLTDCDRVEFLKRVRTERRQPHALSIANPGSHLGVFYEDPNYVPTVPQDEDEQFFSWP